MLWTIPIIFILLWALGLVTSYTLGGYIHVLVILAVVMLLVRIVKGPGNKSPGQAKRLGKRAREDRDKSKVGGFNERHLRDHI